MARERIVRLIEDALERSVASGALFAVDAVSIELERTRRREHGDWSTNVALGLAGKLGRPPREVAAAIVGAMEKPPDIISGVEVAGPGFINFHLSPVFIKSVLFEIRDRGPEFGRSSTGAGRKVQVEFVSANPVGPLHVGHGRWAALGDSLAGVLSHAGYVVEREYYINDYGTQVKNFGRSISARYMELLGREADLPEGGYAGGYIVAIAERLVAEHGEEFAGLDDAERSELFSEMEYPGMLASIEKTLERMGVRFDVWFSERELYRRGEVDETLAFLESNGTAYREDGALWLRTSSYGDEKDRVLVRSSGEPTYFASDIAYHRDKMERGFDTVINIWGADHHGYVARMKASLRGDGLQPGQARGHTGPAGQAVPRGRAGDHVEADRRHRDA